MHGAGQSPPAGAIHRVAGLVRALENLEALTAVLEHLRHERQALQSPGLVQRAENFLLASHLDPIANFQFSKSLHRWFNRSRFLPTACAVIDGTGFRSRAPGQI